MSRRKMIGANAAPKSQKKPTATRASIRREFSAGYDHFASKPGRTHLVFAPTTAGVRIT